MAGQTKKAKEKTSSQNSKTDNSNIIKTSLKQINDISSELTRFNSSLSETLDIIRDITSHGISMVSSFSTVANVLKNLKTGKNTDSSALSQDAGDITQDAAKSINSLSPQGENSGSGFGSVLGGILPGLGAVSGITNTIVGIFKKRKEEEKKYRRELQQALLSQITAETQLSIATAQRLADEKSITREKYKQIEANRANNQSLQDDVIGDIDSAIRKAEEKIEGRYSSAYKRTERDYLNALLKLKNNADDLDWLETVGDNPLMAQSNEHYNEYMSLYNRLLALAQAQEEWQAAQESLLEETIGSTADDLAQSWIDAFEKGEAATWDFAQNFKDVMRQAIINGFADSVILSQIEPIFNAFKEKIADYLSGELELEDVVTPELESQIESTRDKIKELSPELEKILEKFGLEVSGSSSSTLSASIQSVSEETANAVAGQMNAIRSNQIKSMEYLTDSIAVLNKIESNTRYCRHLESIDRCMENMAAALSLRVQGL